MCEIEHEKYKNDNSLFLFCFFIFFGLVMSKLWLQFPHVTMGLLYVVVTKLVQ